MVQGLLRRVVNVTVVYMFILLVNLITIFGVSSGHKKNNIYLHTDYSIINVNHGRDFAQGHTAVLHANWLEPDPVSSAGSSDLADFPGMGKACSVSAGDEIFT